MHVPLGIGIIIVFCTFQIVTFLVLSSVCIMLAVGLMVYASLDILFNSQRITHIEAYPYPYDKMYNQTEGMSQYNETFLDPYSSNYKDDTPIYTNQVVTFYFSHPLSRSTLLKL